MRTDYVRRSDSSARTVLPLSNGGRGLKQRSPRAPGRSRGVSPRVYNLTGLNLLCFPPL